MTTDTQTQTVELVCKIRRRTPGDVFRWYWSIRDANDGSSMYSLDSGTSDTRLGAWIRSRLACRRIARERLGLQPRQFTYHYSASVTKEQTP